MDAVVLVGDLIRNVGFWSETLIEDDMPDFHVESWPRERVRR
jgi:hypothetical protein